MNVLSETHQYGEHPRQQLTIHHRPGPIPCGPSGSRPGILAVHGGYWSERASMGHWPETFAKAGYVVIETQYRLNADALWPAQRGDVAAALAWARKHAERYALDPSRIAAFGSSAGGHLAVQLGALTGRRNLAAVVALSPPLSPYRAWKDGARTDGFWADKRARLRAEVQKLAGCKPARYMPRCWRVWRDMVTYNHASGKGDPPALLLHFGDDMVPAVHSRDFRAREVRAGMPQREVTVATVPGRGHGMRLMDEPGVASMVLAFFDLGDAPTRRRSDPQRTP